MGLFRLWWVPEGAAANEGTYVHYDHETMVSVVALEAHRAGAVVIGEDLGTVEPWVRDYLAERGVFGTSVLWFEKDDGHPRAPGPADRAGGPGAPGGTDRARPHDHRPAAALSASPGGHRTPTGGGVVPLLGTHARATSRCRADRRRRRTPCTEPARYRYRISELEDPAGRRRRDAGAGGGPAGSCPVRLPGHRTAQ